MWRTWEIKATPWYPHYLPDSFLECTTRLGLSGGCRKGIWVLSHTHIDKIGLHCSIWSCPGLSQTLGFLCVGVLITSGRNFCMSNSSQQLEKGLFFFWGGDFFQDNSKQKIVGGGIWRVAMGELGESSRMQVIPFTMMGKDEYINEGNSKPILGPPRR